MLSLGLFSWKNPFPLKKTWNECSKFPAGFQLRPWISGNSGFFDPNCRFLSQIPACSSISVWNCWEHTFPGILAWIGNGTWECPAPKAALLTSHKFFPKEKAGKEGFSLFSLGLFGHSQYSSLSQFLWLLWDQQSHSQSPLRSFLTLPNDFLECLVTSQSHGCATPSGWDGLGAP